MRVSSSRVYLKGSTRVDLQAYLNYTASHAPKKGKPTSEPSAIPFSEHEQVPRYTPKLIAAGPHISVWLRLTKELCVPIGWYARSVQNTAYLHIVKADTKTGSYLLLVSLCLFFKLMQFLIFIQHCCYCNICLLPIHTVLSPQTEVVFALKKCSTTLHFHLWI